GGGCVHAGGRGYWIAAGSRKSEGLVDDRAARAAASASNPPRTPQWRTTPSAVRLVKRIKTSPSSYAVAASGRENARHTPSCTLATRRSAGDHIVDAAADCCEEFIWDLQAILAI